MPPSGFGSSQVAHITAFLRSCAADLAVEARLVEEMPSTALAREVATIRGFLDDLDPERVGDATQGVLQLTLAFYENWLLRSPVGFDEATLEASIASVRVSLEALHVPRTAR